MQSTKPEIKNILFISLSNCGGAERMTLLYAEILRRRGYECRLLLIQKRDMAFSLEPFIPNGIQYDVLRCGSAGLPLRLIRRIMRIRPDCLFDSLPIMSMALVRIMYKRLSPKSKIVFRECNTSSRHSKLQLFLTRLSLRNADAVISQTEEMIREMVKCYALSPERITIINNPIDESFIQEKAKEIYRFAESDCIHYIAVARVVPQKDYQTLLKAFSIVNKQCPQSRLHILGDYLQDREYKKKLDGTIKNLNLEKVVYFEGFQSNPYKFVKAANVFVLSSIYEGLPNVLQEAMYLGKPVVATRCIPYISQVVEDGTNGYTVPTENPEALATALIKAASLRIKNTSFNENGQRIDKIISLFTTLCPM